MNDSVLRQLESYRSEGRLGNTVWVTPELPFIVFIAAGFVTAVLLGNLVLVLVVQLVRAWH